MKRWAWLCCTVLAAPAFGAAPRPGQLPDDVVPLHYDIAVDPDAAALRFTGEEAVTVEVVRPTRTVTFNAADLALGRVRFDGATVPFAMDEARQRVTVTLPRPAAAGRHRLEVAWRGTIARSSAGLFAIDYNDARGPQRMLVTQFEPSDGRRFAPMWDEPGRKATFTLSTIVPAGQTGFSNMPVAATAALPGGRRRVTFGETPRMASYLLFLGVGDVERHTAMAGKTEIGVITRRGAGGQAQYALDSARRLLAYYNDYFGTPFPLPKLDMIAGPGSSQFFGAMENWGAIFYFERDILVDPAVSTESDRQGVFITVAHEMAHQWFGDLVTMDWWDDLWLNEGFASWMEWKAAGELHPEWHPEEQAIAGPRQGAFQADSRFGTHPIVQRIDTPDQVDQAFDTITYQKGQAVIRMLEGAIGPDRFRDGVRRYMAAHKYGNTATDDLWASMAQAAGRPVKPLMDAFTLQPGVPLIRVGEPACAGGATTLALSQERFATDATARTPERWPVPVALAGGGALQLDVAGPAPRPARVPGCGPVVVNPGQYGYYRTLYAPGHLRALGAGFARLPLADQVGTLSDRFYLADAGDVPLDGALALIGGVPRDADPLVWNVVAERLAAYDYLLRGDPAQAGFRRRAAALLAPVLDRVGLTPRPGEAAPASQLREQLIYALGGFGDPRMLAEARRMVAGGMDRIPATIRRPITTVFAENASPADWDMLHAAAQAERNPLLRAQLYDQLGAARDPALAARALALALTEEAPVPSRATLISSAAGQHPDDTFAWALAHEQAVRGLIEPTARNRFIPHLAVGGDSAALADKVEAYVGRTIPADERRTALSVVATIRYHAALKARVRDALATWSRAG